MGGGINKFPEGYNPKSDPTKTALYFNDFMVGSDFDTTNDWTETETGSGTSAINNTFNGELLLTNAAADNDSHELQLQKETFKFISGKACRFKIRFKVSDATQSDWLVGLVITDTTVIDGNTDGVYLKSDDGDTNIDLVVNKNSTASTTSAAATHADDTYMELAFDYDGANAVEFWKDNVNIGSVATTNLPDDEDLTVTIAIQNGEAVAKTMTIDYILAVIDR